MPKKTPAQLDREIAEVLQPLRKRGAAKRFVFVEWSEDGNYRGGNYAESDLPQLFDALRAKRLSQGISIHSVSVDDREVSI